MNEKYTDSDIRLSGDFYAKLDNFWYHHKWKVIAAAFVAFVLSMCYNETKRGGNASINTVKEGVKCPILHYSRVQLLRPFLRL